MGVRGDQTHAKPTIQQTHQPTSQSEEEDTEHSPDIDACEVGTALSNALETLISDVLAAPVECQSKHTSSASNIRSDQVR